MQQLLCSGISHRARNLSQLEVVLVVILICAPFVFVPVVLCVVIVTLADCAKECNGSVFLVSWAIVRISGTSVCGTKLG